MCKPIPGNFVRLRKSAFLKPLDGSVNVPTEEEVFIENKMQGMVDEAGSMDPETRIVNFEYPGDAVVQALVPCANLKAIEV